MSSNEQFSQILDAVNSGDPAARNELWDLTYEELRAIARRHLATLSPGKTIQATALVHEAYLKLVGGGEPEWQNVAHFYGAAARAMRNILVDEARRKGSLKRGKGHERLSLSEVDAGNETEPLDLLALNDALERLEAQDPRAAELVLLRYFAGLTIEETAKVLGVSHATIEREWSYARAWLHRELY